MEEANDMSGRAASKEAELDHLLYPATYHLFKTSHLDKSALHIGGRHEHYYAKIFSSRTLKRLLWEQEERLPLFVRVNKHGSDRVPPRDLGALNYCRWLSDEYCNGSTIVVNNLDRNCLSVAHYLRSIEAKTQSKLSATAYLTPKGSSGFGIHFDTHDVFILQLSGHKEYKLFEDAPISLPLARHQREVSESAYSRPTIVTVNPGDLLYIPRGLPHCAATTGDQSLHLSVGMLSLKLVDILKSMLDLAADNDKELREHWDLSRPEQSQRINAFRKFIDNRSDSTPDIQNWSDQVESFFITSLRALPDSLFPTQDVNQLSSNTLVHKQYGSLCGTQVADQRVRLIFPGLDVREGRQGHQSAIDAPLAAQAAFAYIVDRQTPFSSADLPASLSPEQNLHIVRTLFQHGLLSIHAVNGSQKEK